MFWKYCYKDDEGHQFHLDSCLIIVNTIQDCITINENRFCSYCHEPQNFRNFFSSLFLFLLIHIFYLFLLRLQVQAHFSHLQFIYIFNLNLNLFIYFTILPLLLWTNYIFIHHSSYLFIPILLYIYILKPDSTIQATSEVGSLAPDYILKPCSL